MVMLTTPIFSQGRKRKRSVSADSGEGSASDSDSSHSDGEEKDDDEEKGEDEAGGTENFVDPFRNRLCYLPAFSSRMLACYADMTETAS